MLKKRILLPCFIAMIFGSTPVSAGTGGADEDRINQLGEIVVTAQAEKGVEAVGTTHQITAKELELRQVKTLDKALELLPGLDVRKGAQGIPRVNMRGLRSRHVVLLLNGIPFNSTYDGQFDPAAIPVENIAKIKVNYGTHSLLYGQGGLGGSINIITKKGSPGVSGKLASDLDERGDFKGQATLSGGNEKIDYFVSGSRIDSDGFQLSDGFDPTSEEDGGLRENSDTTRDNLFAGMGFKASDSLDFGLFAGTGRGEYGKPPSRIKDKKDRFAKSPKYDRVEDYQSRFAQAALGYDPQGIFGFRAWAFVNKMEEDKARYDDDNYKSIKKKGSYETTDETSVSGLNFQGRFNFAKKGNLAFSGGFEHDAYDSLGYEIDKKGNQSAIDISNEMDLYNLALEYDITFACGAGLVAGYSHHWQSKDQGEDDDQGSWLMGLFYDLNDTTGFRASYARKIRFASLKNLYDNDSGNADLNTEKSDNFELGMTKHFPWGMTADLVVFQNNVKDYIEKVENPGGDEIYENHDEYRFRGVELFLSKTLGASGRIRFGYGFLDAENKSEGAVLSGLEYRPRHKITLEGSYAFDMGLTAYASFMRLMGQEYHDGRGNTADLDGFSILDLKLEQHLYKKIWFLYAGVDNLLDEDYEESYGFPQPGRTAYAGLKLKF